jgi:Leucine-rich repeat (LRR) protein
VIVNLLKTNDLLNLNVNEITEATNGRITALEFSNVKIDTIIDEIGKLDQLQCLEFYKCHITYISPNIGKLTNITELKIVNCGLVYLPPQISKLTKKSITLSENEKKEINKFLKISDTPEKMTFINIKSKSGDLLLSITFIERYLSEFNQYHTIGVVINNDGIVHDASVIGAADQYSLMLATKSFTGQFPGRNLENSKFQKDINGITGATVSAKVFTDAIRISLKIFEKHLM